jgi:hypothetical protein
MATRRLTAGSNILARCDKYSKYEKPVQSGLALTPRDIKQMTERGLAVSTPNLQVSNDSEAFTDSWFIEPQFQQTTLFSAPLIGHDVCQNQEAFFENPSQDYQQTTTDRHVPLTVVVTCQQY